MNRLSKFLYTSYLRTTFLFLSILFINPVSLMAKKDKSYEAYIDSYSAVAVEHMNKYKIPASITLAQGLLESGAGSSKLAKHGNNHFGIKCHTDWSGATIHKDDDRKNECFRKYKKAQDSYHDHSMFLTQRSRYNSLFSLNVTDYRGWAKGLQNAGYATDKAYANKLIKIIEDYELYKFDKAQKNKKIPVKKEDKKPNKQEEVKVKKVYSHTPYITHGLVYIVAREGDTYESIAEEFDFKTKDLYKHNEVHEGFPLRGGDLIYFQKKNKTADKPNYEHVVKVGESMHSISQIYGVRVNNLYKLNKKKNDYVPVEGDILRLR